MFLEWTKKSFECLRRRTQKKRLTNRRNKSFISSDSWNSDKTEESEAEKGIKLHLKRFFVVFFVEIEIFWEISEYKDLKDKQKSLN